MLVTILIVRFFTRSKGHTSGIKTQYFLCKLVRNWVCSSCPIKSIIWKLEGPRWPLHFDYLTRPPLFDNDRTDFVVIIPYSVIVKGFRHVLQMTLYILNGIGYLPRASKGRKRLCHCITRLDMTGRFFLNTIWNVRLLCFSFWTFIQI